MDFQLGLTWDDVALVPQFSNIPSRTIPNLSTWLTKSKTLGMPLVPANMDTVMGPQLARVIIENGGVPIFHRFASLETQIKWVKEFGENCFISTGIGKSKDTFSLLELGAGGVCVDVAHGHSKMMFEVIKNIKDHFPSVQVIAGNICSPMAYQDLVNAGADAVKVGIGPGCFAAGTRILMANATYKNIEDIKPDDRVINKDGIPVRVVQAFKSGYKKVSFLRSNTFYKETVVTPDHQFWAGNLSSTSTETLQSWDYIKALSKQSKTIPKLNKIDWFSIGELKQECLFIPRTIDFDLPKFFEIPLKKRVRGNGKNPVDYEIDIVLTPSYDLGYIFGTFLGDGCAHMSVNKNGRSGSVNWFFGASEDHFANKLQKCIHTLFKKKPTVSFPKNKNTQEVNFYYKPLADFLIRFGKRHKKHLPNEFLVKDFEYLQGLYDGLVDSDGCISDRIAFYNTSPYLIELFNVCNYLLYGYFPNNEQRKPSTGGLEDCNIENCKPYFVARELKKPAYRQTKEHQIIKILEYTDTSIYLDVYDLEVDCDTHSFIANNTIVHNSACTTRLVTGFGVPQFTAVYECAKVAKKLRVPIIGDGGIRNSRDVVLALAAGASTVMIGKLFALTEESAAQKKSEVYYKDAFQDLHETERRLAKYRGQASEDFQSSYYGGLKEKTVAEGVDFWSPVSGSAQELIDELLGGLRSGLTYGGAKNIKELQQKAEFIRVTSSYNEESKPRS